jgi:hypothetical protein
MVNLNKPAKDLIIDLLNESNREYLDALKLKDLTEGNISLGTPSANEEPAKHNTKIVVNSVVGGGFYNSVPVSYDRLSLSVLFSKLNQVRLDVRHPTSTSDLLPRLNKKFGLQLSPDDIVVQTITGARGDTVTLTAQPEALCYIGSVDIVLGFEFLRGVMLMEDGQPMFEENTGNPMFEEIIV